MLDAEHRKLLLRSFWVPKLIYYSSIFLSFYARHLRKLTDPEASGSFTLKLKTLDLPSHPRQRLKRKWRFNETISIIIASMASDSQSNKSRVKKQVQNETGASLGGSEADGGMKLLEHDNGWTMDSMLRRLTKPMWAKVKRHKLSTNRDFWVTEREQSSSKFWWKQENTFRLVYIFYIL